MLFELARRGFRALLIERTQFAGETTGRSAAIVRMHYSNAPVVRMALRSRRVFQQFREITGAEPVYFETGWTYVVPDQDLETVCATVERNRAEGVEVLEIGVEEASDLYPGLSGDGIGAIFLEPESGFADPHATTVGFIQAARSLGARAEEGVTALRLAVDHDAVTGVATRTGLIGAGTVVLAAGPWSADLAATAGIELPFQVTREQELYLDVPPDRRPRAPMSDLVDRIYFRPMLEFKGAQRGAMIVGRGFPKPYEFVDPNSYDENPSPDFEQDVRERLRRRLPELADRPRIGGVSGLYAVTPDWHPYLGPVDGVENLVLATGGSGHCFKLAPAIGEMVAAEIAGEPVNYADIGLFNLRRIAQGALFSAAIGGNRA